MEDIRTIEEARNYRYGKWGGNPQGFGYVEDRCAKPVWSNERWSRQRQCSRKNGFGINGLYCKQHAQKLEAQQ